MTHNHNLQDENPVEPVLAVASDLPEIDDVPEALKIRTKDFKAKYALLEQIPLGKGISIEGQRTKWTYAISEYNKLSGKKITVVQTVSGLYAKRVG